MSQFEAASSSHEEELKNYHESAIDSISAAIAEIIRVALEPLFSAMEELQANNINDPCRSMTAWHILAKTEAEMTIFDQAVHTAKQAMKDLLVVQCQRLAEPGDRDSFIQEVTTANGGTPLPGIMFEQVLNSYRHVSQSAPWKDQAFASKTKQQRHDQGLPKRPKRRKHKRSQPADDTETTLCADRDAAPGGTHQAPMYVSVSSLSSFQHLINGQGCSSLPAPMHASEPDQTSDKSDGPWSGFKQKCAPQIVYDMWDSNVVNELCRWQAEADQDRMDRHWQSLNLDGLLDQSIIICHGWL
jgi:hypothetical protein